MPYRKADFRADHYYHLYNRGVDRQPIFMCSENWGYFLTCLRRYFVPTVAEIVAYCLMPNHYHLLVHLCSDDLSAQVMQPLTVAYSKAVNKQQNRVGPLFQGPFRAVLVERDEYLTHLSRYIHLNPVVAGLATQAEDWAYSSYRDYVGLRNGSLPHPDAVLSQFPSREAYRKFVDAEVACSRINHLLAIEQA